jgi:hypothetical protein
MTRALYKVLRRHVGRDGSVREPGAVVALEGEEAAEALERGVVAIFQKLQTENKALFPQRGR